MSKLQLIWPYSHEDKTSWKYIDFQTTKSDDNKTLFKKWIRNPGFKYKYLDKPRKFCICGRRIS